ncbi:ROK family protein [Agromyces silvae]|uniref:ROK family protein n=1 Tax=Agromyces silvae TaxID=3388266 RepID=UPI0035A1557A
MAVGPRLSSSSRIATMAREGAEQAIERALDEALRLAGGAPIAAVALATPGVVEGGRVRQAPNLPGLEELDVPALIARRLPGTRLRLLNDVNAATVGLRGTVVGGSDTALVVGLGTGIAAGLLLDGRLWEGSRHAAGELGEALICPPGSDVPVPLEVVAGGRALDELAAGFELAGARQLLDAADDPEVRSAVLPRLDALAGALAVACRLLDPDHLVLFGGLAAHPLVRARVERMLVSHRLGELRVHWVEEGVRPAMQGAVAAAVECVVPSGVRS